MADTSGALRILIDLGLPPQQQREIAQYTLLALAKLSPSDPWSKVSGRCYRIFDIMQFMSKAHGRTYAPNTREDVRRQVIHQFEDAKIVVKNPDDSNRPVNSPNTCYALTKDALDTIRAYGTQDWKQKSDEFKKKYGTLTIMHQRGRWRSAISITLPNGQTLEFSPGKHNQLQAAVIGEFGKKFLSGSTLLYVGDAAHKMLYSKDAQLNKLRISITRHEKLPDVLFLWSHNGEDFLVLIEAVTSHGPVSPKRQMELEDGLKDCQLKKIYVTAFIDFAGFKKYVPDIAWGTEVWIREIPDHIIHFNGPTILGPTEK